VKKSLNAHCTECDIQRTKQTKYFKGFQYTPCTKIIDVVWKLVVFVSMLYRITKTSRNETVILRVYNTYPISVQCMHPWSHRTHPGSSLIGKLQHTEHFLLRSRYFLFVTSRTERGGSGIAHAIKTRIPTVSFHARNMLLLSFPKTLCPLETAPVILVHAVYHYSGKTTYTRGDM
jgi:hypothetical protein